MSIGQAMAMELQQESAATRRHLECLPEDKYSWKPHEKSMSLGQLASHLAESLQWVVPTVEVDDFEFDMEGYKPFVATSKTELLAKFDENLQAALAALQGCDDEAMGRIWKMSAGGQTLMEMPRVASLRGMILNHSYHHRGQLTVYIRLLDIPLQKTYGPTADDTSFGM